MYAGAYKHSAMYQRGGRPVNTGHQEKRSGGKVVEDVEESDLERAIASFEVPVVDAPKGLAAAADGA